MYIFKGILGIIIQSLGTFTLGFAAANIFKGNYQIASYVLLGVSILFLVGYFVERWSK